MLGEEHDACTSALCKFLHSPVTSSLLDSNMFLRTLFSENLNLWSSLKFHYHTIQLVILVAVNLSFKTLLTSQVISVFFYSEREKSDRFCSEDLIQACGSFMCHKPTTWDPQLYFPSEGSHTQDFYTLKKSIDPGRVLNLQTSDPVESMITTGPPGSATGNTYNSVITFSFSKAGKTTKFCQVNNSMHFLCLFCVQFLRGSRLYLLLLLPDI